MIIVYLILAAIVFVLGYKATIYYFDQKIEKLSSCLTEKGVVFYGADWCDNCKLQRQLFKKHMAGINYVECSVDNGLPQATECAEKKIVKYPTWLQNDDKRVEGVMKLKTLAREFGCQY